MQGNNLVIEQLNAAVKAELTAIVQYIVHAEMCRNWGYERLGKFMKSQAIHEMHHLDGLIERILFLDGTPKVDVMPTPKIGTNVREQLQNDLAAERDAVGQYNAAVRVCREAGDNGTRELFEKMVRDEEEHTHHLEGQLHVVGEVGADNYLAQQIHGDSD